MVYAFIIHTLLPGTCRVLYYQVYGEESICDADQEVTPLDIRNTRKRQVQEVATQVHSEYQFRRAVANKSVDEDLQSITNDDTLPDMELGFNRLPAGTPFLTEKILVWMGAGNTGFTLVCQKTENRVLAENVLKVLIRYLQEHVRILNQPSEAVLKADRLSLILSRFLPEGSLIFMNHRFVRGMEKELEILMKT